MKKTLSLISFLILAAFAAAWAQDAPNRFIVLNKTGHYKGFMIDRIDECIFRTVEGRVAADLTFNEYVCNDEKEAIYLTITKSEDCWSYQICLLPTNTLNAIGTEENLAAYVESLGGTRYTQDFENAEMTGFEPLEANADYSVVTLGYDQYGVACSTCSASFHTPEAVIVGNPNVAANVLDVTGTTFTILFEPNDDVQSYSYCSFGLGEAEMQFNMWGPMFGFATIDEMVYSWGIPCTGPSEHTWTAMSPGTEYEVLVAIIDKDGNYAPMVSVPVTTVANGGNGVATVTIALGEFGGDAENGYYQRVVFTPNDQTNLYHAILMEKTYFEEEVGDEMIETVLKSDSNPYNPWDPWWDLFAEDNNLWNADPETTYIAFAMAQNALGEWGPLAQLEYTTPEAPAAPENAPRIAKRIVRTTSVGTTVPPVGKLAKAKAVAKGIELK